MRYTKYLVLFVMATAGNVSAESLWRNAGDEAGSLFIDTKARQVGDIVTIVIQESASVSKAKDSELKKSSDTEFNLELFRLFGLENRLHSGETGEWPAVKWDSERNFKGEADNSSTEQFSKTMSAVVKEVLPNGNLLIEGVSDVVTDEDITTVTVTGIIRPIDISPLNTILSHSIANARINYQAKGPLKQNTKKGWLNRFIDAIWPF